MAPKKSANKSQGKAKDGVKPPSVNRNGKKASSSSSSSSSSSFFNWFIVLALLGVWTSVAVVYFDLVDYQGVIGKLAAYDSDGDGDFDVEDAKILLDEKSSQSARRGAKKETSPSKDVGWKLREALKQQLAIIHERVEAKKLAKLALAEVRQLLAKEEEEEEVDLGRKEITAKVKERVAARLKEEEEKMEKDEMEQALRKLQEEKAKRVVEETSEDEGKREGEKSRKVGEKKERPEKRAEGKKEQEKGRGKEKKKKSKAERGGKK